MKNKTPIESLDAILIEIKDITNFNVYIILANYLNYNFENESDVGVALLPNFLESPIIHKNIYTSAPKPQ